MSRLYGLYISLIIFSQGCVTTQKLQTLPALLGQHSPNIDIVESAYASGKQCQENIQSLKTFDSLLQLPAPSTFPVTNLANDTNLPLSPGDIIDISITHGDLFNGQYTVDAGGFIKLPMLSQMQVAGISASEIEQLLALKLVRKKLFKSSTAIPIIKVIEYAQVAIPVSGAVYSPGRHFINVKQPDTNNNAVTFGDFTTNRLLSEALRAAHGVRPDANLKYVTIYRNGWAKQFDVSGIFSGEAFVDYPLIAGDRVHVPSTGCFDAQFVRPSQVTPKGFRLFVSNLLQSSRVTSDERYVSNIPYGTRLLKAAVSANCAGGSEWVNANRKVVLVSVNPTNNKTHIFEGNIETIINDADNPDINPYVLPNDSLVCYDANIDNLRQLANSITDLIRPFTLF